MESEIISTLTQYGVLGLWTASLLYMNWQQRKERLIEEEKADKALKYHQSQIVTRLTEQNLMLNKAIEKIDAGLRDMREKYAEDRMLRLKDK